MVFLLGRCCSCFGMQDVDVLVLFVGQLLVPFRVVCDHLLGLRHACCFATAEGSCSGWRMVFPRAQVLLLPVLESLAAVASLVLLAF